VKTRKSSSIALFAFCITIAAIAALALAVLFAGASVAFARAQSQDDAGRPGQSVQQNDPAVQDDDASKKSDQHTKTISGLLTDSHCGARHPMSSGKSTAECVKACVRKGNAYMLVDGEHRYILQGNQEQLAKLAGQRVTVTGNLEGKTIQVSALSPEQLPKP
jgi:Mg-chelatase subunit ChlD